MTAANDPNGQEPQKPHGAHHLHDAADAARDVTDSTPAPVDPGHADPLSAPDSPEVTQRVSPPQPQQPGSVPSGEETQPAVHYPAQQPYDPNLPPLTPDQATGDGQQAQAAAYQQYAQYSQFAQHDAAHGQSPQQPAQGQPQPGRPHPEQPHPERPQYEPPQYAQPPEGPRESYAQRYFEGQPGQFGAPQQPQGMPPQGQPQGQPPHPQQPPNPQAQHPQQAMPQGQQPGEQGLPPLPQPQRTAQGSSDLAGNSLVKQTKRPPRSGWRKALYVGTGKLVNPGEGPADRAERDLTARVQQPLRGCYKIGILSLKGGVGKTTTTTTLGSTFASLRGDRVIAVDANPDRGTLAQKIPIETTATVRHLLRDADRITRYSDVRAYTSQGGSRLEILASEQDPAVSEAFSENDYRRAVDLLEHFYNIVLTDCGTGLMHSAMKGVLDLADSLVIVSSGSVDGARSASATLDWLDAHGYGELVQRSITVINSVRPKSGSVDLDKLTAHFSARTRGVVKVPFDPHLEEGAEIDLDRLDKDTRTALLELAATVADGFAMDRMAH
ncbi:MinD-like ATPase involved in chromosome partitioning or flagellar assembly [Prauserella aidingensis]|nr:MinD/ParA family protein [Prauserella aidingensis]MCP2252905.1 MinD-like ATPase involved in chromosome partitioning or flagellar assembly [Prauserella aidingensis]